MVVSLEVEGESLHRVEPDDARRDAGEPREALGAFESAARERG